MSSHWTGVDKNDDAALWNVIPSGEHVHDLSALDVLICTIPNSSPVPQAVTFLSTLGLWDHFRILVRRLKGATGISASWRYLKSYRSSLAVWVFPLQNALWFCVSPSSHFSQFQFIPFSSPFPLFPPPPSSGFYRYLLSLSIWFKAVINRAFNKSITKSPQRPVCLLG